LKKRACTRNDLNEEIVNVKNARKRDGWKRKKATAEKRARTK